MVYWISEVAKALAYAIATTLIYIFLRMVLPYVNTHKATGTALLRVQGTSLMLLGFFVLIAGALCRG